MKKSKILTRSFSVLLIATMLTTIAGCTSKTVEEQAVKIEPMEIEEVASYSFDFIGGKDVMPIMGYYTPHERIYSHEGNNLPYTLTDEFFQLMADSGINILGKSMFTWSNYSEEIIKMLELGEKYGLGVLVDDDRIVGQESYIKTVEDVDSCLMEYVGYPAYIGNYIIDEPSYTELTQDSDISRDITVYAPSFQKINELGFFAYGNLLPSWVSTKEAYQKYLAAYIEMCSPAMISYDHYPFDGGDNYDAAELYFSNLTMIRQAAEANKIPFWSYIQCGAQWNDSRARFDSDGYFPSQGSFYWNVGTALAFGAKGIQYFPLIQPEWFAWAETEYYDFERNGIIGAAGNINRWYYYAQAMNAQIAAVDEVLMNSVNKGVIATGDLAEKHMGESQYLIEGDSWRELKSVKGDSLIGCFNYYGKTALYVVNYDIEYAQNITLSFQDTYNVTVIQNAETSHVATDSLELTFAAGDSALIVFE